MTKQEILEAFEGQFVKTDYGDGMQIPPSEYIEMGSVGNLRNFLSTSIDSLLQDVLSEADKISPPYIGVLESNNDRRIYESGWGDYKQEVKELIKSKINL